MAKVVWTQEAERWLLKIPDYVARDKPAAAFEVVQSIYRHTQVLEQFPEIGHAYKSASGRETRILLWGTTASFTCSVPMARSTFLGSSTGRWSWISTCASVSERAVLL